MSQFHIYQGDFQTKLVPSGTFAAALSPTCNTGVTGAITRAMAEYLMQLELLNWGGRTVVLRSAYDEAPPTAENRLDMPAAVVIVGNTAFVAGLGAGDVGAARFPLPDGSAVVTSTEIRAPVAVRLAASSKEERHALQLMFEQGMTVDPGLIAVRLQMPYYYNATVTFSLVGIDSPKAGAGGNIWPVDYQLVAETVLVRADPNVPDIQTSVQIEIDAPESVFPILRPILPGAVPRIVGM